MRARWNVVVGAVVAALLGAGMPVTSASPATAVVAATPVASSGLAAAADTSNSNGGEYVALTPSRVANSADGTGGFTGPLSGPGKRSYVVGGKGGVPTTGVSAVSLQVTLVGATADTYATVWATGQTQAVVSHVSVQPNEDATTNMVITALGTGGSVDVWLNAGTAGVIIDVHGYYTTASSTTAAGSFQVVSPTRLADSRTGQGIGAGPVGPGQTRTLQIGGVNGVPSTGVVAVALNVTVADPTAVTYTTVWDTGATRPPVSNVNAEPLTDTSSLVQVKLSSTGQISLYNNAGNAHLVVDLAGYYLAPSQPDTAAYVPLTATRVLATTTGQGTPAGALAPMTTLSVPGRGAVDSTGKIVVPADQRITAVALTITAAYPTQLGHLRSFPEGEPMPQTSVVNFDPTGGQNSTASVVAKVGTNGRISIHNVSVGSVHVVIDVQGYFLGEKTQIWQPPLIVHRTPTGDLPTGPWPKPNQTTAPQTPGLGSLGFFPFHDFALAEGLDAQVNIANGNLLVRGQDVSVTAPGIPTVIDRFYNAQSTGDGAFGPGWVMSTGRDVGLSIAGSTATFYGPSGVSRDFPLPAAGQVTKSPELKADLTKLTDGTFKLTYRDGAFYTFSAGGFLISSSDRNGLTAQYRYNTGTNTLASITDPVGRVTTITYNTTNQVTRITDPAGRMHLYTYTSGRLTQVQDPDGAVTTYTYGTNGKLATIKTPRGSMTKVTYDTTAVPRVTAMDRYLTLYQTSGTVQNTKFAFGTTLTNGVTNRLTTVTDPRGGASRFTVEAPGRVIETIDQLGRKRTQEWTTNSDLAKAVDAMASGTTAGNATTYSYDTDTGMAAGATIPTGASSSIKYKLSDCGGTGTGPDAHKYLAKCSTDPQGNQTRYEYDTAGNTLKQSDSTTGGTAAATSATYQSATSTGPFQCGGRSGQLCTVTDAKNALTKYDYDADGNQVKVTPPAPLAATTAAYDVLGRLTSFTDGKGQTTRYFYDAADRLTRTVFTGGSWVDTLYDADGNTTQIEDTTGGQTTNTYDGLNRQTGTDTPNTGNLSITLDLAGNTETSTDPSGTTTYTYDAANQLKTVRENGGTACAADGAAAGCTWFDYDANGNQIEIEYPGGTKQITQRDLSGRPTRITATNAAGTPLSDLKYDYTTPAGLDRTVVQKRTDHLGVGAPDESVTTYTYDTLGRLKVADENTSTGADHASWTYTYDNVGNRTKQARAGNTGMPAGDVVYGYNAADQLTSINGSTSGLSYDLNGNETAGRLQTTTGFTNRTSTINSRNQITATTSGGTAMPFTYTGTTNDQRLTAGSTSFQNSLLGLTATTTGGVTTYYTRTPGGTLLAQRPSGGSSNYYLTDNLGSVVGLVNNAGTKVATYAYDPYGVTRVATGTAAAGNPFRYTGGHVDTSTGLYKLGARYYDPTLGRFTQPDPSGQEINRYLYAAGDPCNRVDPSGLLSEYGQCALNYAVLVAATFAFIGTAFTGPGVALGASALFLAVDTFLFAEQCYNDPWG
jgi:RHS repeat-associated protein